MGKIGYFKLFLFNILTALLISAFALVALTWLTHEAMGRNRGDFILFLASAIEDSLKNVSNEDLRSEGIRKEVLQKVRPGPPGAPGMGPRGFRPPPPPPGFGGPFGFAKPPRFEDGKYGGPKLWIVSEAGSVLLSEDNSDLPRPWEVLPKSPDVHQVVTYRSWMPFNSEIAIVKLERSPNTYLVFKDDFRPLFGPLFATQILITFGTLVASLLFSLSITFIYLRRKSIEARAMFLRLEQGDLKARFEIKRFDEFGGLLVDFNRMAGAIERLVLQVRSAENARKNLLEELGHDIRTPLTSLTTSFETFKSHFGSLTQSQRDELFEMMTAEVDYLRELIEQLMTIATLHEPGFRSSTELVDISELLTQEVHARNNNPNSHLNWSLNTPQQPIRVVGDGHLLLRMFRNSFDNASRFAKSRVEIAMEVEQDVVVVRVVDDGSGFSQEALDSFGKRQEQRKRRDTERLNFSLGLGSAIMKAISEAHFGSVYPENQIVNGKITGASIVFRLPISVA